ncbi:MAG: XRE family transcriptional regulator [Candidatus Limnocylindrales bacterium]
MAEIRGARQSAGLSQHALGAAVGLTASEVGRFERGDLQDVGIDRLCRMAAAVGMTVSLRLFPAGDPVRDAGQMRLLDRLRGHVPPGSRWRPEVPLFGRDDARAWDAVIDGTGCVDAVEAETRFVDTQATERRIALKMRDDPTVAHVILLLADTRLNRRTPAEVRESLRATYPIDGRVALARIAEGRCPGGNAIVVL